MNIQDISVVVPIYKEHPTQNEIVSLTQMLRILYRYPITFICSDDFNTSHYEYYLTGNLNFKFEKFENCFFRDIYGYNTLLKTISFYKRLSSYKKILIYQLDAYVFRDELQEWCDKDFCFIGAPWFNGYNEAKLDSEIIGVGNGGFSIRDIPSTMKLLEKIRRWEIIGRLSFLKPILFRLSMFPIFKKWYTFLCLVSEKRMFEDVYYSDLAKFYKFFKIANIDEAIKFSFEVNPKLLFEKNNKKLPFGCHGWEKYEFEFWSKYINIKK